MTKTITQYHVTLTGWNEFAKDGGLKAATRISLMDVDLMSAIKRAKKIYPKKHWWVTDITEHVEPVEQIEVQKRMATAMEKITHEK